MMKTMTTLAIAALSFGLSGCRMCCPSYDYCGPTEPGESNSECCGMHRRGSILGGAPMYAEGATYVDEGSVIGEYDDATPLDEGTPLLTPPAPPSAPKAPAKQPSPPMIEGTSARRTR